MGNSIACSCNSNSCYFCSSVGRKENTCGHCQAKSVPLLGAPTRQIMDHRIQAAQVVEQYRVRVVDAVQLEVERTAAAKAKQQWDDDECEIQASIAGYVRQIEAMQERIATQVQLPAPPQMTSLQMKRQEDAVGSKRALVPHQIRLEFQGRLSERIMAGVTELLKAADYRVKLIEPDDAMARPEGWHELIATPFNDTVYRALDLLPASA